jgi:hypothetical protein
MMSLAVCIRARISGKVQSLKLRSKGRSAKWAFAALKNGLIQIGNDCAAPKVCEAQEAAGQLRIQSDETLLREAKELASILAKAVKTAQTETVTVRRSPKP